MRFDTEVTFIFQKKSSYANVIDDVEKSVLCNVTDLNAQRSFEIFGERLIDAKAIRLREKIDFKFNYVLIDNVKYVLSSQIKPLNRQTVFVKRSVQNER